MTAFKGADAIAEAAQIRTPNEIFMVSMLVSVLMKSDLLINAVRFVKYIQCS